MWYWKQNVYLLFVCEACAVQYLSLTSIKHTHPHYHPHYHCIICDPLERLEVRGKQVFEDGCLLAMSPDDGGSKDLWNVGKFLPDYTVLQTRRQPSSYSPPWEPQILQNVLSSISYPKKFKIKIYKSTIYLFLYKCKTWFLSVTETA
jgi:hypothetical protein